MKLPSTLSVSLTILFGFAVLPSATADDVSARNGNSKTKNATRGRPFGIDQRGPWTSSRITGSPVPPPPYQVQRIFPKLQFLQPVTLCRAPGTDRLFVVQLSGQIYSLENDPQVQRFDPFLDLSQEIEGFRRAFGLTFHPDFSKNRYCYVSYVLADKDPLGTRVSRFTVTDTDPPRVDPLSEQILIRWYSGGHNGGCLEFGPDGYLYISTGDGSPPFPPDGQNTGQDVGDLLGSILRIDVDHPDPGLPYGIPKDNPFVELAGARGEVWSYGLRNPWKMSFDPATGDLWVGDVGWEMWELVYRVQRGGNYGWSIVEGSQSVFPEGQLGPTPILPPVAQHSHTEARSVTGGYVYRGKKFEELVGAYIYGDYVTGKIWGLRYDGQKVNWLQELADTSLRIICFAVDSAGELFVVGYDGTIHRLVPNDSSGYNPDFPRRLSQTGLFSSTQDHEPASGVIPYSINAEPWADHAVCQRFIALPGNSTLLVHRQHDEQRGKIKGAWHYPADTVLAKTISLEMQRGNPDSLRRLETQVLHQDGDAWRGYTYIWNDEQTDAVLADAGGLDRIFTITDPEAPGGRRQQTWRFSSRTECFLCHNSRMGMVIGFEVRQLNKDHDYGNLSGDQLRTLDHIGIFSEPLSAVLPKIPSPDDETIGLGERVRAYLHVNCSHCHRRGGGGTASIDVRFEHQMSKTNLLDSRPTQGTFGIHDAWVVASGDPYRSVLFYRMAKLGRGRMPHFGPTLIDEKGLGLIRDWIRQMPAGSHAPDSLAKLRTRQSETLDKLRAAKGKSDPASAAVIDRLFSTASGALQLQWAIQEGSLSEPLVDQVIRQAIKHADVGVRDLFERFVPTEERIQRLGSVIEPAEILILDGDVQRGKQLFFESKGAACRNCHRIDGKGRAVGPDLDQIGKKYNRVLLLETILQPSKAVEEKYIAYLIETTDGQIHSGLLVRQSAEEIVLKDAQGNEVHIPTDEIELLVPQRKSLMPELLLRDMTAQQVADLLKFLGTLK